MNIHRRRFLKNIALGGITLFSAGLSVIGYKTTVSSVKGLSQLATLYTDEVGKYVSKTFAADAEYCSFKLNSVRHHELDASGFARQIQEKIAEESRKGQLYEFKGWVITKTEAFLSGLIVELA